MTILRLVRRNGATIGPALAGVDAVLLARRGGAAYAEIPAASTETFVRSLALCGVEALACDADLRAPPGLFTAIGTDLRPVPTDLVDLDVVRVRRLPLGDATREALRRRLAWLRPPDARARARCRALLRGEHVVLAWGRQAWATRGSLRTRLARASLRPVVFDREASSSDLPGRVSSRDDALGRWLFA